MSAPIPRSGILEITPYKGGENTIPGANRVIKLSSNESALGPSPKAVAAFKDAAGGVFRYPDGNCGKLRDSLGQAHGLDPARIVCGAGSDELFALLARAYAGPDDEVLYNEHGFLMFPIVARAAGATPVKAPEKDLRADVDAFLERITPNTRILFLANPNNPTGSYLSLDELKRLRAELPARVLMVLDAAYAEYVTADDYAPGVELVDAGDNVVMTRTFSKIFGLGGMRLGWGYCPPAIADILNRVRTPFNVSGPAQAAGLGALADTEFTRRGFENNSAWRPWLAEKLRGIGLLVPPSEANFILVRFPDGGAHDAEAADAFLKENGIITRRMVAYGLPSSLRISIGVEDEMRAVAETLARFMG